MFASDRSFDPASTRQLADGTWIRDPFLGNIIPQNRFSSVTTNVLKHDLPNPLFDRLRNNVPRLSSCCPVLNIDNISNKIDYVLSEKHKLNGSFVYNDRYRYRSGGGGAGSYQLPGVPIPGPAISGDKTQLTPGWIIRLSEDWTISSTKLNHMALGYNRFRNANQSNALLSGTLGPRTWSQRCRHSRLPGHSVSRKQQHRSRSEPRLWTWWRRQHAQRKHDFSE